MSEEATTETTETATQEQAPAMEQTSADAPANVRETPAFKGVQEQAAKYKADLEAASAELAKFKEAQAQAEEAKKLEEGKHLELIEQLKGELSTMKAEAYKTTVRDFLREAGMRAGLALDGALHSAPEGATPEQLSAWVAELKEKDPTSFAAEQSGSKSIPNKSAGQVAQGTVPDPTSYEQTANLKPEEAAEKNKEIFKAAMSGIFGQ